MDKKEYFVKEKGLTDIAASILIKKLEKYSDISEEFDYWLAYGKYRDDNAIEINGYSAKQISEIAPHLDAAGVYGFMVTLRDDPEKAKQIITDNFPVK